MSANNLYRGLFDLLTLPAGADGAELAIANTAAGRRELLSVARMEGCLPELYARWAAASLLSPSESIEHEQIVRRRAAAADVVRALPRGSLLADASGVQRGAGALEVLIADFAAIASLHEAVARLGYRLQPGGDWLVPVRGAAHRGVARFRYAMGSGKQGGLAIDVQVGAVALDDRRQLPFADLAGHAPRLDGSAARMLSPTCDLLHRIAALGAQPTAATVRQIADIHLLLKTHAERIDHGWLRAKIELLGAWAGLRQIREAVAAKRLGALLSWGEFGRLVEVGAARAEAHAAQQARPPRIGSVVHNAFALAQAPRQDDITARLARAPGLVASVLNAGYRVRGVPVSSRPFDAPRFMRIDGALYLATGAGLILLSLVDLDDAARSKLGERVRSGGRPVVLARWTAGRTRTSSR